MAMTYTEFSRSWPKMDYSQVGLPKFLDQNEKIQPPHERMKRLEATMAELERVYVEQATSQPLLMKEVNTPPQEKSTIEREVDELAITRAKTQSRSEFFMEETI